MAKGVCSGANAKSEPKDSFKDRIDSAFIDSVSEKGLSHTQISRMLDALGISRNTFYYYYGDKHDLARMIFLRDLSARLEKHFDKKYLLYHVGSNPKKPVRFAYYARVEVGSHAYDMSGFLQCLISVLLSRARFYSNLFSDREAQWNWEFEEMYFPELKEDVLRVLGGRYMDECMVDYLARVGVGDVMSTIKYVVRHPEEGEALLAKRLAPFLNFYWESLSEMVTSHPLVKTKGLQTKVRIRA